MHIIWSFVSTLTFGAVQTRGSSRDRTLYLTFDDGPHPDYTPQLLRVLNQHQALATFFMQGKNVAAYPDLVRHMKKAGHTLGNHSFAHPRFRGLGVAEQIDEIDRTDRELERCDGQRRHLFRPPHGEPTLATIVLCMIRRKRMALWTHDSYDFRMDSAQVIDRFADFTLRPGDILLFHDDGGAACTALSELLPKWREDGFRFQPL